MIFDDVEIFEWLDMFGGVWTGAAAVGFVPIRVLGGDRSGQMGSYGHES